MAAVTRTLVFVPLREEMTYIDGLMKERRAIHNRGVFDSREDEHVYTYFRPNGFLSTITFRVLGDMGNLRAATAVAAAYVNTEPELVLMSGLAGSLDVTKARLGDVFVVDMAKTIYADKIKRLEPTTEVLASGMSADDDRLSIDDRKLTMGTSYLRFRRDVARGSRSGTHVADYVRTLQFREAPQLTSVDRDMLSGLDDDEVVRCCNPSPQVKSGVVFGSDMVIDSDEFIAFVRDRNEDENLGVYAAGGRAKYEERNAWRLGDLPIVDMESYGLFKLAEDLRSSGLALNAFAIRGVSDLASGKGRLDRASKDEIRRVAVRNAALVTLDFLDRLDGADPSSR